MLGALKEQELWANTGNPGKVFWSCSTWSEDLSVGAAGLVEGDVINAKPYGIHLGFKCRKSNGTIAQW